MTGVLLDGKPKPAKPYKCEACEVWGIGDSCWSCGTTNITTPAYYCGIGTLTSWCPRS